MSVAVKISTFEIFIRELTGRRPFARSNIIKDLKETEVNVIG
jgi:hypothetical protein